jgi:hypothetical protein
LLQLCEAGLALGAYGHDASRHGDYGTLGFQIFRGKLAELLANLREGMCGKELIGIRLLAECGNLAQLIRTQREKIALEF